MRGAQGAPGSKVSEFLYSCVRDEEAIHEMILFYDYTTARIVRDELKTRILPYITKCNVIFF